MQLVPKPPPTAAARTRDLVSQDADSAVRERGYAVVPFADHETLATTEQRYWQTVPSTDAGLVTDYMRDDRALYRELAAIGRALVDPLLNRVFLDHRVVMTTFVTKHPHENSMMFLHEDRTFVDETIARAFTLWIPFVDTGPSIDNGGLEVVPGSHRLPVGPAGSLTPDVIRPFEDHLRKHLKPLTVPQGSAAVYDSRLLHASPSNLSDRPRVALVCAVVPARLGVVHVVGRPGGRRTIHHVDDDFFLDVHPRRAEESMPSKYPIIDTVVGRYRLTPNDVAEVFGELTLPTPHPSIPIDVRHDVPPRDAIDPETWHGAATHHVRGGGTMVVRGAATVETMVRFGRPRCVVRLGTGARLLMTRPRRTWRSQRILVLDADVAGYGIATGRDVACPEPGTSIEARQRWVAWNDGLDPLVIEISGRSISRAGHASS